MDILDRRIVGDRFGTRVLVVIDPFHLDRQAFRKLRAVFDVGAVIVADLHTNLGQRIPHRPAVHAHDGGHTIGGHLNVKGTGDGNLRTGFRDLRRDDIVLAHRNPGVLQDVERLAAEGQHHAAFVSVDDGYGAHIQRHRRDHGRGNHRQRRHGEQPAAHDACCGCANAL